MCCKQVYRLKLKQTANRHDHISPEHDTDLLLFVIVLLLECLRGVTAGRKEADSVQTHLQLLKLDRDQCEQVLKLHGKHQQYVIRESRKVSPLFHNNLTKSRQTNISFRPSSLFDSRVSCHGGKLDQVCCRLSLRLSVSLSSTDGFVYSLFNC